MIEGKFVDLYARNSGLRDKLVAERDVVLTYALRALLDAGVMDHMAFKGGTCLRKLIFGSAGRFSEDLDFTLDTDRPDDDVLAELVEVFNGEHHGVTFTFDEYYKTDDDTSFGGEVLYSHSWNDAGRFRLQVSLRERPTLPAVPGAMKPQAYFSHLEFDLFDVRLLEPIEMIGEKVRADFQRVKVRDLYDLHRFATTPFNGELLRRLALLKLEFRATSATAVPQHLRANNPSRTKNHATRATCSTGIAAHAGVGVGPDSTDNDPGRPRAGRQRECIREHHHCRRRVTHRERRWCGFRNDVRPHRIHRSARRNRYAQPLRMALR